FSDLGSWQETGFLRVFRLGDEKYRKKPGFSDLGKGQETGFLRVFRLGDETYRKKPGFSDLRKIDLKWVV
ncbi:MULTISPECIES: hypothetical protein, partial [unclassified Microcoleus]|uniref:hypothetical protein n=1 Tax=unclassified Microcoleus TaxID=2642155 RepID=UPI001DB49E42